MPNWCMNNVTFTHEDPEQIKRVKAAVSDQNLFETFVPPEGEWDYFWCVENWGTKWDASHADILNEDKNEIELMFDTAWGPPLAFYDKMVELGFTVEGNYHEPGMCFIGEYSGQFGNEIYNYDFTNENWRDNIDNEDILERLEEEYQMWKESEEEFEEIEDDRSE